MQKARLLLLALAVAVGTAACSGNPTGPDREGPDTNRECPVIGGGGTCP